MMFTQNDIIRGLAGCVLVLTQLQHTEATAELREERLKDIEKACKAILEGVWTTWPLTPEERATDLMTQIALAGLPLWEK